MSDTYRISWEMVSITYLGLYSDADPRMYSNTTQTVPNSQIPDEHWHPVSRETSDPWSQYDQLRKWAEADTGFVRKVILEQAASAPTWVRVEP